MRALFPLLISIVALLIGSALTAQTTDESISKWPQRAKQFYILVKRQDAYATGREKELVSLLSVENKLYKHFIEDPRADQSIGNVLGDEYETYYDDLFDAVLTLGSHGFPEAYAEAAKGAFEPDTRAAELLVQHPMYVVDSLIEQTSSREARYYRWKAVRLIPSIIGATGPEKLSPDELMRARAALLALEADPDREIASLARQAHQSAHGLSATDVGLASLVALLGIIFYWRWRRRRKRISPGDQSHF